MFKKKRGRPSNAYKRKVKTMKILSLASIIAISGITIYGLSGYIKENNDRLGASIEKAKYYYTGEQNWEYNGVRYSCETGKGTRYGNTQCAIFREPASDHYVETCDSRLAGSSYDGYKHCKDKCKGPDGKGSIKEEYIGKCIKWNKKSDGSYTYFHKDRAVVYYCQEEKASDDSEVKPENVVSKNGKCAENITDAKKHEQETEPFTSSNIKCNDDKTITFTVVSNNGKISKCEGSSNGTNWEDRKCSKESKKTINSKYYYHKLTNESGTSRTYNLSSYCTTPSQSPTPSNTGETPTNDGKTNDSNDTPSEQNNDNPSNEDKPKELPELKIISSNGTNLTNKEYSRNLCTNSPFYISGAKVSEVSIKSDKLKITNSLEKTSTDKAIIEPSKEIKKGEKVQITVTREEDKKEAKVTFVNNTDCESLKVCKKLGKININHGMTIMDKKVITLKQDAYFGLNLWVYPINVNEKSSQIDWKSSNPNVVEIIKKSDQGIQIHAKAKSNKTVKISASLGGKTTYFKVKVNAKKGKNNPGGYDNAPKMVNCEEKKSIEKAKIENIPDQEYTGKVITPTIKVTVDSKELKNGTDYELVYSNNVNPGTAKVRIIGKGLYTRSKVVTFTIKSSEEKISRITVSKKTRNLSDEKCSTDPLKVTFTNVEDINIEDVYYSTDNGAKWNVLNSEKEGPNATITLNKTYNYLLIKVKDEEGNYSKIYGPYNINIQKSCNTLKKVTTIKISGIKKENKLTKRIKVKIQAKSNIKTIQISTDGKKTWVVSKKCTINKNEATCNIDSKHKSLYYRVITVNNEYQEFGEYIVK